MNRAKRFRWIAIQVAIWISCCCFLIALPSRGEGADNPTNEIDIVFGGGEPQHLNTALISGSAAGMIGAQIFASPLRYDSDWNPMPYLARAWELSEDGLSATLHLVENAVFHDGHPITSSDVAFSVMTVKKYHPFRSMFEPVERVDTPDEHTAIIRLVQPHPGILLAMSPVLLPILPEHIYGDGQDLMTHPANSAPVGSGPFVFESWTRGEEIRLVRFDDYFLEGRPFMDRITVHYVTDPAAQLIALERQDAHLTALFTDLDELDRMSRSQHLVVTNAGTEALGPINWLAFNLSRSPVSDIRVRQAIAYAIDADFIVEYLHRGRSIRADSPISPESPFYNPDIEDYAMDLEFSRQLLDEAGYGMNEDGERFALTLDYIPALPSQQHLVAHYIAEQLEKVGIRVTIRHSDNVGEWIQFVSNWDFDMTMDIVYNWGDPSIGVQRTYECSNIRQGVAWSNTQNYCSQIVDDLLARAATEIDPEARRDLYFEFQRVVEQDLPIVWLNLLPFHTVYNVNLANPPLSIWGIHSPLDELQWIRPPDYGNVGLPELQPGEEGSLKEFGIHAGELIQTLGLYEAIRILDNTRSQETDSDPQEFGYQLLGVTQDGTVFLDTTTLLPVGTRMDEFLNIAGENVLSQIVDAADRDGNLLLEGAWPHPVTHRLDPVRIWCNWLTERDLICVLEWIETE